MAMGYDAEVIHNLNDTPQIEVSQLISIGIHSMRVVGKAAVSAGEVIARLREVVGAKNDSELAAALGLGVNAPSNWRQRNSPPYGFCADVAHTYGVSMDWLVFGRGPKRLGRPVEAVVSNTQIGSADLSPSGQRITQFVVDWDGSRAEHETIWLEQHIKRTVPEYADWLAEHPAA
jgi:hypothetical protein